MPPVRRLTRYSTSDIPGQTPRPPHKLPRLSTPSDDEVEGKAFLNHPTLYFEDGNVLLSAGRMLFRVHRSVLSNHSTVFQGLFEQKHGTLHECTCIPLEHAAEELEALIKTIYADSRVEMQRVTVETFPNLANILRMATHYEVERARADVVSCIAAEWPSTLAEHTKQLNAARAAAISAVARALNAGGADTEELQSAAATVTDPGEKDIVNPASVIALLRECGYASPALLFPLFYALSRATWQLGGPAIGHSLSPLSREDAERLLVGVERLRARHASLAIYPTPTGFGPPLVEGQPMGHWCVGASSYWVYGVAQALLAPRNSGAMGRPKQPIEDWLDLGAAARVPGVLESWQVCRVCASWVRARLDGVAAALWNELAGMFLLSE